MALKKQPNQLQSDATEFGIGVRCGGWRLGLLVARNVEPGQAGRPAGNTSPVMDSSKVSMTKFAELAGTSQSQVTYYYKAWQLAAKANLVPNAAAIQPGDEEICVDADAIEVEDDPKTQWSWFYSMAKNPPKPKEVQKDSKPKQEKQPDTPAVDEDSDDDESDSVDSDFGIASFTKEEAAEADSSIQRNALLEILETVRAVNSRIESAGRPTNSDNEGLLGKIAGAALEVNMTADALMAKEDAANN